MHYQQVTLDRAIILPLGGFQSAMEADKPLQISAGAGPFQHRRTTETVAHGHGVGHIGALLRGRLQTARQQGAHPRTITVETGCQSFFFLHRGRPDTGTEEVHGKNRIPLAGQHLRPFDLIIGQPVPVVNKHHQRRPVCRAEKIPGETLAVDLIRHRPVGGSGRIGGQEDQQKTQDMTHGRPPQ